MSHLSKTFPRSGIVPLVLALTFLVGCGSSDEPGKRPPPTIVELAEPTVEANGDLKVKGGPTIRTAGPDYRWKLVTTKGEAGVTSYIFACLKPDSTTGVALTIWGRKVDDDATRLAILKGHFEALRDMLQQQ